MKRLLVAGLFSAALVLPQVAHATHHRVFVSKIIKLSDTSCAVELQICSNGQNGFVSGDNVKIGSTANTFGSSAATEIDTGGHVNTGDHILTASSTFSSNVLS